MTEQNINNEGFVILAGAGPGDAELITLKLQKRLTDADVIITDRLVNPDIISTHARNALILFAGKQGYNDSSFSQEEVTTLIIEHAQQGKKVLRLKGGDVAFFSNVLDELDALTGKNIPFHESVKRSSFSIMFANVPELMHYAKFQQFVRLILQKLYI